MRQSKSCYFGIMSDEVENIREHAQLGSNPAAFIDAIDKMKFDDAWMDAPYASKSRRRR